MGVYASGDVGLEVKDDQSPLTRADTEANAIICRGLVSGGGGERGDWAVAVVVGLWGVVVWWWIRTLVVAPSYEAAERRTGSYSPQCTLSPDSHQAELAPHVPIISEENKQLPYSIRKGEVAVDGTQISAGLPPAPPSE